MTEFTLMNVCFKIRANVISVDDEKAEKYVGILQDTFERFEIELNDLIEEKELGGIHVEMTT